MGEEHKEKEKKRKKSEKKRFCLRRKRGERRGVRTRDRKMGSKKEKVLV